MAEILDRVNGVCQNISNVANVADNIADIVKQIQQVTEATGAGSLLPAPARARLIEANELFEKAHAGTGEAVTACDRVRKALKFADKALADGFPVGTVALGATGVGAAGIVIVVAVILANTVTIHIHNQNCNAIAVSAPPRLLDAISAVLPGIDLPSSIPTREERTLQIPKALAGNAEFTSGKIVLNVRGFGHAFSIGEGDINASTWDGTPVARLEGTPVSLGNADSHQLMLVCPTR